MLYRKLFKLILFVATLTVITSVGAETDKSFTTFKTKDGVFKSSIEILGPFYLGDRQSLRVCSADFSQQLLKPKDARQAQSNWVSIGLEVYRSTDLLKPLDIKYPDMVFSGGKGQCADLSSADFLNLGERESLVVVLTSISEARSGISPIANAQFFNGVGEPEPVGLLLPAVIAARESGSGGGSGGSQPKHCCPGWPACAFGLCP